MINNTRELLVNIAKKAPWLIESTENCAPMPIRENSHQVIDDIRDYHLTIIADSGRVYRQYLTIKIENDRLKIDKPFKWQDSTTSFHVFFRNNSKVWKFFLVEDAENGATVLSARIPEKIYTLLKRRHRRVPAPAGTKAIFKNHNNLIDIVHVKNISEGGMLICDNSSVSRYPMHSMINEIFLTIPPDAGSKENGTTHRVLPFITKGKITRIYQDINSSIVHYGISFQHENANLYKRFNQVVSDFENHLRQNVTS
ncbi:MAG: hypothetical protein KKG47_16475 [Proteobacteria bacterium]|nr:hypothetical protein [Pseudomonadota bacterium]MBU1739661.1 hypothetical protein [Pseudomonadota bacterium]